MTPENLAELKEWLARSPENVAELKELLGRGLLKLKEVIGRDAVKRLLVVNGLLKYNEPTGGDESLIIEENGFESAQRVGLMADEMGTVDTRLGVLYEECTKFVVRYCLHRMRVGGVVEMDEMEMIATEMGVFRKECEVLWDECAKSAADLCIKKMRIGAVVDKLDKRTILVNEIAEATMLEKLLQEKIRAFETNFLRVNEVARKQEESQAYAIVQENDVGSKFMDDKQTEISGDKVKIKASAFESESLRVLTEMMKGVKIEEEGDPRVDEAMALADEWAVAWVGKCLKKVCYGFLVERHFIFEVLKSEIAETRRMGKEVHDGLVIYHRKHAHAQGSAATAIVKHLNERFGFVWQNLGLFAVGTVAVGIVAVAVLAKAKKW